MALFSVQDKCYIFRLVFIVKLNCIGRYEKLQLNIIIYLLSVTEIYLKSVSINSLFILLSIPLHLHQISSVALFFAKSMSC